jgi:hypothetical protein
MILERKLDKFDEELKSITDRIYRIMDRLIIEYSSLYEKILRVEKKLEELEKKLG